MLPVDYEFILLYISYLIIFLTGFYFIMVKKSKSKKFISIILSINLLFNIILFSNTSNFHQGGSLVVLFYSSLILIFTVLILLIGKLIRSIKNK